MQRDAEYLIDILESAKLVLVYVKEKTKEDFFNDSQCQDAVIRRLEIIGEAARRISDKTRSQFPDMPWKDMIGMRNFMIHEYDDVDLFMVWETVQTDMPLLINVVENIIQTLKKS